MPSGSKPARTSTSTGAPTSAPRTRSSSRARCRRSPTASRPNGPRPSSARDGSWTPTSCAGGPAERPGTRANLRSAWCVPADLRGELAEVVDAERLLDTGHPGHHRGELVGAELLAFQLGEALAKVGELGRRDDLPEHGEDHGVLPGLVRLVHAVERLHRRRQLGPRGGAGDARGGGPGKQEP